MIDPELERRLSDMTTLLKLWNLFQQFFESAVKGAGVTADNERKFLELKSRIAMLHDTFMDIVPENSAAIGQSMLENVIRAITLKHLSRLSGADVKKMQLEWHESYLLLNESIGLLEEEQSEKAKISGAHWQTMQAKRRAGRVFGNLFHSWGLRVAVVVVALLIVLVALPMMGVFSYGALRDVGALQKPVFVVIEMAVRPYLNKNLAWRSFDEAKRFGRVEPATAFGKDNDFEEAPASDPGIPRNAMGATGYIGRACNATAPMPGGDVLRNAKEFQVEVWARTDNSWKMTVFYFLCEKVEDARKARQDLKGVIQKAPNLEVFSDYNLVIVMECSNTGVRSGFRDKVWEFPKVAE